MQVEFGTKTPLVLRLNFDYIKWFCYYPHVWLQVHMLLKIMVFLVTVIQKICPQNRSLDGRESLSIAKCLNLCTIGIVTAIMV